MNELVEERVKHVEVAAQTLSCHVSAAPATWALYLHSQPTTTCHGGVGALECHLPNDKAR